jgi:methyl-accepting chemotaxis protein
MSGLFDSINARVSLRDRMRILSILMVVPVAITGWLLYRSHMEVVDFARSEETGAHYIAAAWPALAAGATDTGLSAAQIETLKAEATRNARMLSPEKAQSVTAASGPDLLKSAAALIAEVTDKSKLILDPDLDSYYMMDAVTTRLPATVLSARALYDAKDSGEVARQLAATRFADAAAGVADSLKKSGDYQADKSLSPATADALAGFTQTAGAFGAAPDSGTYAALITATTALFEPANGDLAAMQKLRGDKAMGRMIAQFAVIGFVLLLALGLCVVITNGLSRRLTVLSGIIQKLARGEATGDIPYHNDRFETGAIAAGLKAFADANRDATRLREEQDRAGQGAAIARRDAMLAMAEQFESSVLAVVDHLDATARTLGGTADELHRDADQTRKSTIAVAQSIDEATGNIQSVAGATEEMSASSKAIADQAAHAADAAQNAASMANETHARVTAMLEASERIGASIGLITEITSQTNLLALNATIEAARAGEAGRGFNVVATEVKALANQTARATAEISEQVKSVQDATRHASNAMNAIADLVMSLRDISNGISESVIQQTSAVAEISRSTLDVADSTARINQTVAEVSETAGRAGDGARLAREETHRLSEQSQTLKTMAMDFLKTVRTA